MDAAQEEHNTVLCSLELMISLFDKAVKLLPPGSFFSEIRSNRAGSSAEVNVNNLMW